MAVEIVTQSYIRQLSSIVNQYDAPPAVVVPHAGARTDGEHHIFKEIQQLTGYSIEGDALAGATVAASPHTLTTVETDNLLSAVSTKFQNQPALMNPGFVGKEQLPAHLVVFWRANGSGQQDTEHTRSEIADIANLSDKERRDVVTVAATKLAESAAVLHAVTGHKTTMYGLFGPPVSYGGGHAHVAVYEGEDIVADYQASAQEKLKMIDPWMKLFLNYFGDETRALIENAVHSRSHNIESEVTVLDDGRNNEGLHIAFPQGVPIENAFDILVDAVGVTDAFYQLMHEGFKEYHMIGSDALLVNMGLQYGVREENIEDFVAFITRIKPTYEQITTWIREMEEQEVEPWDKQLQELKQKQIQYEEIRNSDCRDPERQALRGDTYSEKAKQGVLFSRLGGAYEIEHDVDSDGNVVVTGITLIFKASTNGGIPEKKTGNLLLRNSPSSS